MRGRALAISLAGILLWLVGFPLAITLLEALGVPARPSLDGLREFASRGDEWMALWRSLWISLASVVLAGIVGVPLAFFFELDDFPGRRLVGSLVALPVALPPLVGVLAFLFLFGESGFASHAAQALLPLDGPPWRLGGPLAILLVHAYSMFVFFYLFTRAALAQRDPALLEAAASLGAGRLRTLVRVTLPLLGPALGAAGLLTFMTSLASFSAPYIFGGGFRVMTTQIVASKLNGELRMAQVETLALAALALVGLWLQQRLGGRRQVVVSGHGVAPAPRSQGGRRRWARALLAWVIAGALLLPHLTLLLLSFVPPSTWTVEPLPPELAAGNYHTLLSSPERLRPILNSLWMAAVATAGAVCLGFAAARGARRFGGRLGGALELLVAIPWAVPGTVFAIALSTAFSVHAPLSGRFVLVGTVWILPLAYLVRSLPVTGRASLAALRQLDPALEEVAASLGAGPWRRFRRVVLPRVRPAILAAASLAFLTALGDFVTSIVLYTYSTRPISIEILSNLRVQETGLAAVYGVFLMLASAIAFLVWGRETVA